MALLFMDSFDHYATADILKKWSGFSNTVNDGSVIAAVGRNSTNGWKMMTSAALSSAYPPGLIKSVNPGDATAIVGIALKPVSAAASYDIGTSVELFGSAGGAAAQLLSVRYLGSAQCWIKANTDGTLSAYRDTTLLGTTSAGLSAGVYTYIEVVITISDTVGVVTIYFNGSSVLSLTGQNTRDGTVSAWNSIRVGPVQNTANVVAEWHIDDVYILDGTGSAPLNAVLGDCRVDCHFPNAAGNTSNWTRSTGADQYATIDETAPNGDTDYNETTAIGNKDTLNFPVLAAGSAAVYGVQVCCAAKKTAPGGGALGSVIRHSSTDYVSANQHLSTDYTVVQFVHPTNPGTGLDWTESDFNAAEFGYQKTV